MTTGEKIKQLREQKLLTQEELAVALNGSFGVTHFQRHMIAHWEVNQHQPKWEDAKLLVLFFGISLDDLFFEHLTIGHKRKLRRLAA